MNKYSKYIIQGALIMALLLVIILPGNVLGFKLPDEDGGFGDDDSVPIESIPLVFDQLAAENDNFQLYYDQTKGQIKLVSKVTGAEWFGAPEDSGTTGGTKNFVESPIYYRYTEGSGITQTNPYSEEAEIEVNLIEDGLQVVFNILGREGRTDRDLVIAVEYLLKENGIEARIPYEMIRDEGRRKITSIELLPFFNSGEEGEQGALFLPDGSGALVNFKDGYKQYYRGYNQFIYGGDHAFFNKVYERVAANPRENVSFGPQHQVAMPVFGVIHETQASIGIVTEGEYDARIVGVTPGERGTNFYRTATEFIYRNDDLVHIGNTGGIPMYQRDKLEGDRAVRYILLEEDEASYIGLAHAYRDYLINEQGIEPIVPDEIPLQLRLFGGILQEEVIGQSFVGMTTFEQAQHILEEFMRQGVNAIEVTYSGWSRNGLLGTQPRHFPADRRLGGNSGLSDLVDFTKANNIELFLKANYVKSSDDNSKIRPSREAIRGLNKEVIDVFKPYLATYQPSREIYHYIKPRISYDRYLSREINRFQNSNVDGVHFEFMGDTLFSDQDPRNVTTRAENADYFRKSLQEMREAVGKTVVDYGFAYTYGNIDRIDNAPIDSNHYVFADEAIPFYQIVMHGLIPYTSSPANLRDDKQVGMLRSLEYGAMPSFELTYEDAAALKRTNYTNLFSSQYEQWLPEAVAEYMAVYEILNDVRGQKIVDHEKISSFVFRTTYEDGTQVTVNYSDSVVQVGAHRIQPYGYAVSKGGS